MQFDEGKMAPEMTMLLMEHIQTQAIRTYATKVDAGKVWIAL